MNLFYQMYSLQIFHMTIKTSFKYKISDTYFDDIIYKGNLAYLSYISELSSGNCGT